MARRVGEPGTLARVLTQRSVAQWNPRTLARRNADLSESWRLADRSDERLLAGHAAYFGVFAALEAGEVALADRLLNNLRALVEVLGQPIIAWFAAVAVAARCVVVGSPEEAEELAFAAYDLGTLAGQPDALVWFLGGLFTARFLRGRLADGEPNLPGLFAEPGSAPVVGPEFTPSRSIPLLVGAAMSATCCEVGRLDDGRRHLELVMSQLDELPDDYATLAILAQAAVASWHLYDADAARRLAALLEPHATQFVNTGASWFGAVEHHLALLRATLGERSRAEEAFDRAERAYARIGAQAWLERCRRDRERACAGTGPAHAWHAGSGQQSSLK